MSNDGASAKLVLVIDDDDGVRDMLGAAAGQAGFRVETAVDGEEGLAKAESIRPDLIVLDLMLPRYGGFELLKHLQSGTLSRVPIVVVTGRYTDPATAELIRAEANVVDFMTKPVQPLALAASLRRVLGAARPSEAS